MIGPSTFRDQVAVLPFLVEQYGPESRRRYLVSKINKSDAADLLHTLIWRAPAG
jgi:hypothetical protein